MLGWYVFFFALYVLALILIGYVASRKPTEEGFMLANRKLAGTQIAATMSAGFFDGFILSLYMAYIYAYGLSAIWAFVGLMLGFLLLRKYAGIIKKTADKHRAYSMPEYFYKLFGKRSGIMFSLFILIQFFVLLIVNLIVSGKVLAAIFPISYALAVCIGGAIILTYLLLAGFKAVVRTDIFQLCVMFLLIGGVALLFTAHIPSIALVDINVIKLGWSNMVAFLILGTLGMMVTPDLWQRIFAAKDQREVKRGSTYAAIVVIVLGGLLTVVGLVTKALYPAILPEDALVTSFQHLLPGVLAAAGLVLLYAVTLSSSDTATFVVSSLMTRDAKNYNKRYRKTSMRFLTRTFILTFIVLAVLIAATYTNILQLGLSVASLNIALFPVVFGSFYWKLKERAVFYSLVLAFASVVMFFCMGQLTPETAVIAFPVALVSLFVLQKIVREKKKKK